jgi:hypothetical protein
LTATPSAGSTFAGWSGAGCSGTGMCVVTMSAAQNVTATFNAAAALKGSCTLAPKSNRVAVKTHTHSSPRTHPDTITLIAICKVGARATVTGTVTEHLAKRSRKPRTKLFRLATVHVALIAAVSKLVVMKVPASVVLALKRGTPESAAFTMTVRTTAGTIRVTATIAALQL